MSHTIQVFCADCRLYHGLFEIPVRTLRKINKSESDYFNKKFMIGIPKMVLKYF